MRFSKTLFVFALLLLSLLAEGTTGDMPLGTVQDTKMWDERKRHALAARFKRGRPEWETTAPDHAGRAGAWLVKSSLRPYERSCAGQSRAPR